MWKKKVPNGEKTPFYPPLREGHPLNTIYGKTPFKNGEIFKRTQIKEVSPIRN